MSCSKGAKEHIRTAIREELRNQCADDTMYFNITKPNEWHLDMQWLNPDALVDAIFEKLFA